MNDKIAWEQFKSTGKVLDYLNYIDLKNNNSGELEGDKTYEAGDGRINHNGKKYL